MSNVFGFSNYSPSILVHLAHSLGYNACQINSVADATAFNQSESPLPKIYLWSSLGVFSRSDYGSLSPAAHLFFGDRDTLIAAGVELLDATNMDAAFRSVTPRLTKVLRSLVKNPVLPEEFLAFSKTKFSSPESLFSREVKKTAGRRKRETDPVFTSGSLLRRGIKELLDLCGHGREISVYQIVLKYVAFLAEEQADAIDVGSYEYANMARARKAASWAKVEDTAYRAAVSEMGDLLARIPVNSLPSPSSTDSNAPASAQDRLLSAMGAIREWHANTYSLPVVTGYLMCLKHGMPEGRAVYQSNCDPSALNILCRNMDLIRPSLKSLRSYYSGKITVTP